MKFANTRTYVEGPPCTVNANDRRLQAIAGVILFGRLRVLAGKNGYKHPKIHSTKPLPMEHSAFPTHVPPSSLRIPPNSFPKLAPSVQKNKLQLGTF